MKTRIKVVKTAAGSDRYITQYKKYGFWCKMNYYSKPYEHVGVIYVNNVDSNYFDTIEKAQNNIDLFLTLQENDRQRELEKQIVDSKYIHYP